MPGWVVDVWNYAIVSFAEGAAWKHMSRCEAGGFLDAVEEQDLVRWRNEENTMVVNLLYFKATGSLV
jgi:hypothetical protein